MRVREHPLSAQVHPPHRQKHPLKIKEKLRKIPCDTKIEQKIWLFKAEFGYTIEKNNYNPSLRFELNDHQSKSTPWRFDNSPPMEAGYS